MKKTDEEPWFAIQQQLMDDERGVERDALLHKLADHAGRIKRQLDAGVAPAEFARLTRLRQGLEAAATVVTQVWRRYHVA